MTLGQFPLSPPKGMEFHTFDGSKARDTTQAGTFSGTLGMSIKLRAASPDDASDIARLIDIAGDGLPCAIWSDLARPNQTAIEAGASLIRKDTTAFTWRRARVAESEGEIAGLLISHDTGLEPEQITETTHPALRPLIKLENTVPKTRCISILATFPEYRRGGVARALMQDAETRPGEEGMSLVTAAENFAGRKFYTSLGYREAGEAPMVLGTHGPVGKTWLLMRKRTRLH